MEGQQLPKATMNAFVKSKTNLSFSADFIQRILTLSKEFITRLADKANNMCQANSKKTISGDHLEAALTELGLTNRLHDLRSLEGAIKEQNQLKREASQRLQQIVARDLQEEREKRLLQQQQKKEVTERQRFEQLEKADKKDSEEDYENLVDIDDEEGENAVPNKSD